ncbi:MAG: GspE/PulE family protein [Planctomycetota bacterium]
MIGTDGFIVEHLVTEGLLDRAAADEAVASARAQGAPVDRVLIESQAVSERDMAMARATLCEVPFVDLDAFDVDINNSRLVPRGLAEKHGVFVLFHLDEVSTVAVNDPLDLQVVDRLRALLHREIDTVVCERSLIDRLVSQAYRLAGTGGQRTEAASTIDTELTTGDEPIVAALNQILTDAIDADASDIHISPCERELQLRYRIDGRLRAQQGPPVSAHPALVQRLKVMSGLDLTQTRRPQDGKCRFEHRSQKYELRVSLIPTVNGENAVLRILRPNADILGFDRLGVPSDMIASLNECLDQPHGMLLVTGPTGSGKTSTLYTAVKRLNTSDRNIVTIEDPVEIRVAGVRQVQANAEIGLGFAEALRSVLRQDPDVVLVGEIRDPETARIATQAALTGHIVLSTLHTNESAGAIARMLSLEVPAFALRAALLGVIAQRLVRTVCPDCATIDRPDASVVRRLGIDPATHFKIGAGCARCHQTGYHGRVGIFEMIRVTHDVGAAIERGAPVAEIESVAFSQRSLAQAYAHGPMRLDGVRKVELGITSVEEVARVIQTKALGSEPETDHTLRVSA